MMSWLCSYSQSRLWTYIGLPLSSAMFWLLPTWGWLLFLAVSAALCQVLEERFG